MGGGKEESISQIAQGFQLGTRRVLNVGYLGFQNQLKKKTIYKKGSAQNSAFCAGLSFLSTVFLRVSARDRLYGRFRGICPWIMCVCYQMLNYRSQVCEWTYLFFIWSILKKKSFFFISLSPYFT